MKRISERLKWYWFSIRLLAVAFALMAGIASSAWAGTTDITFNLGPAGDTPNDTFLAGGQLKEPAWIPAGTVSEPGG